VSRNYKFHLEDGDAQLYQNVNKTPTYNAVSPSKNGRRKVRNILCISSAQKHKVRLSLFLTKHHAIKNLPVFNYAPCQKTYADILKLGIRLS